MIYETININGIKLIFSPFHDVESAALGIFLKVGSRYEKQNVKGIAHFVEHMLFKGSRKYSYKEIKQEIEGRGGALNGFTSQEMTAYYASFLNKNLGVTLDILLDMVFNPLFKSDDIEKERSVILQEIKMYNDLPSSRASTLLDELLWPKHPLGQDVIGHEDTVGSINRDNLVNFKNDFYQHDNMVIVCSGNVKKNELISLVKQKIKKSSSEVNLTTPVPVPLVGNYVKTEKKQLQQTHLCLGFRSVSYSDKQRLTAELVNVILGANMSSRLFEEIREKKALCYDVSTDARKYKDSGAFVIHVGLDKSKLQSALSSIFTELDKIKNKPVPARELSRAKDYLLGQTIMGLERPQGRMFYLAESDIMLGEIHNLARVKKEIALIGSSEIKKFSQDIFNFNNFGVSYIGNIDNNSEDIIRQEIGKIK